MRALAIISLLAPLLGAASLDATAAPGSFTGAWTKETCHKEQGDRAQECFVSTLYLVQQGERVCGSHFFMHANTNMDEGDGISLIGTVVGNTLVAAIDSARDESQYLARARVMKNRLHWQVVEKIRKGNGGLDPYIWGADLSRMRNQDAMASVIAACAEHFRAWP